jgi:PleD family two-component response regulator
MVTLRKPPDNFDSALRLADVFMYQGKEKKRKSILHAVWSGSEV